MIILKLFCRKRVKKKSADGSYWQSYSDMMAALLLVFILIMESVLFQSTKLYEEKLIEQQKAQDEIEQHIEQLKSQQVMLDEQQKKLEDQNVAMQEQQRQLDQIIGVKAKIIEELSNVFENSNMSVAVDPSTGAIMLDSNILFDFGKSELKDEGKRFLDMFIPMYFNVLLSDEISPYISEIIIEGHTDTTGTYMSNLKLSQERALSVSSYCFDSYSHYMSEESLDNIRKIITANGRSWNDLVYNEDGSENSEASRRVEFKFRLKDDEMIDAMMEILNEREN